MSYGRRQPRSGSSWKIRLMIAGGIILFSLFTYYTNTTVNPVTGEKQRVSLSPEQEVALGLQAAPEMIQQHRGESRDYRATATVEQVGSRLVNALFTRAQQRGYDIPYRFDFHLLADRQTINAFALPGGQVFITEALYDQLQNEAQLAGVLGHEVGHVIERHGAQRMAQSQMFQGVVSAAGVAGGDMSTAQVAQMVANFSQMKYGRGHELESDRWGVELMAYIGYDPSEMLGVMDILERASGGGGGFMSTHPKPANRKQYINEVIAEQFPQGVPRGLKAGRPLR